MNEYVETTAVHFKDPSYIDKMLNMGTFGWFYLSEASDYLTNDKSYWMTLDYHYFIFLFNLIHSSWFATRSKGQKNECKPMIMS